VIRLGLRNPRKKERNQVKEQAWRLHEENQHRLQVKEQARLHKQGQKEGQQRPQKRQKRQRGTDWVGLNFKFVKLVTRFQENDIK